MSAASDRRHRSSSNTEIPKNGAKPESNHRDSRQGKRSPNKTDSPVQLRRTISIKEHRDPVAENRHRSPISPTHDSGPGKHDKGEVKQPKKYVQIDVLLIVIDNQRALATG